MLFFIDVLINIIKSTNKYNKNQEWKLCILTKIILISIMGCKKSYNKLLQIQAINNIKNVYENCVMIFYEKNICGMMFSKRELNGSAAEEASRTYMVGMQKGETFRQKDWKMYHILNLVLCDKAYR